MGYGKIVRPRTELSMHYDCIDVMKELHWQLVAHEWLVTPGCEQDGQGDLVFKNCLDDYLVMEVKRRNSKYVYKQSQYYAAAWKLQHDDQYRVFFGVWTSYKQEIIGVILNKQDARLLCNRPSCSKFSCKH